MDLIILFFLSVVQNASFTWVSRTRNSADVRMHGLASLASNALWFTITVFIWGRLWTALTTGDWDMILYTGVVYVVGTTLGAVGMMSILLRTEHGRGRVGAHYRHVEVSMPVNFPKDEGSKEP